MSLQHAKKACVGKSYACEQNSSFKKKNLSIKQVDKMNALTVKSYSLMDKVVKKMVGGVIGAFMILSSFRTNTAKK